MGKANGRIGCVHDEIEMLAATSGAIAKSLMVHYEREHPILMRQEPPIQIEAK